MKLVDDRFVLDSGRTFRANRNIIGLSLDPDDPDIGEAMFGGYDGGLSPDGMGHDFTLEEEIEIAEYMALRWSRHAVALVQAYAESKS